MDPVAGTSGSVKGFDNEIGINSSSYKYVFQYKDHLGNVRLSYSDLDLNGAIDPNSEIIEESNYYPFGLEHKGYNMAVSPDGNALAQQWKYNGTELSEELGLNVTEMLFRQYDPAIGRFNVIDGLAEAAVEITPYRFALNNPIFFTDPTGLWERTEDGGYSTSEEDEIDRFMNYIKQESSEVYVNEIISFVQDDITFTENIGEGLPLSTATVVFNTSQQKSKMSELSIHKMRNEIAYYQGRTNYLYTKDDYEMRNKIVSGRSDPINRNLLRMENEGNYGPITAQNYIRYIGNELTARMLIYGEFSDMMGSAGGGPKAIQRNVIPRYLGLRTNQGSLSTKQNGGSSTASSTSGNYTNASNPFKNMSFQEFHHRFSSNYRGKFQGRGTYMTHMAMDWHRLRKGL